MLYSYLKPNGREVLVAGDKEETTKIITSLLMSAESHIASLSDGSSIIGLTRRDVIEDPDVNPETIRLATWEDFVRAYSYVDSWKPYHGGIKQ